MGTHPIFESDFDCLTDIDSYTFGFGDRSCCSPPSFVDMSADPLSIILLVILFALLAGLAFRSFGAGTRGDTVVFVGLSDSGKTSMLAKLANPEVEPKTQLSIVSNQIEYNVEKKQLKLVDIPGNEKIRLNELQKYKNALRGVVFVVNSKNIGSQVRDLAELIFQVLTDEAVHSRKPKILLAASHQDAKLAKAGEAVQKLLETEL